MGNLRKMGVKKLFLHLDGWADPGYDNKHPDYRNACKEAGGWEGMKDLVNTVHRCGFYLEFMTSTGITIWMRIPLMKNMR